MSTAVFLAHARQYPDSLLSRYVRSFGENCSVPVQFRFWSGMALVAATLGQKAGLQRANVIEEPELGEDLGAADAASAVCDSSRLNSLLYPNLYMFFIGPSGCGKSRSISHARSMLPDDLHDIVQPYDGRITGPALLQRLGGNAEDEVKPSGNLWLQMPEVDSSIGPAEQAQQLVPIITELYETAKPFKDSTIGRGEVQIESPCINWTIASNERWARKAIPEDAFAGGFWARIIVSYIPDNTQTLRQRATVLPAGHRRLVAGIQQSLREIAGLAGTFQFTSDAATYLDDWYVAQQPPQDRLMLPWWNRERDHVCKMAMILAVSERSSLVIERHHVVEAIEWAQVAGRGNRVALDAVGCNPVVTRRDRVLDEIIRAGDKGISRSNLYRAVHKQMDNSRDLDDIIKMMMEAGYVESEEQQTRGRPMTVYFATTHARLMAARREQ